MPFLALAAPVIAATSSTGLVAAGTAAATPVAAGLGGSAANQAERGAARQRSYDQTTAGQQAFLRRKRSQRLQEEEQARIASGKPPPVPYNDPTDAYMRVLARQATDREMRAGSGRAGAFTMADGARRYRLGGRT